MNNHSLRIKIASSVYNYARDNCLIVFMSLFIDAGFGHVDVAILDPHGHKDTVKATVVKRSEESWYVEYKPKEEGLHSVNVFFAGKAVPGSPFGVGVSTGQHLSLAVLSF